MTVVAWETVPVWLAYVLAILFPVVAVVTLVLVWWLKKKRM